MCLLPKKLKIIIGWPKKKIDALIFQYLFWREEHKIEHKKSFDYPDHLAANLSARASISPDL